MDEKLKALLVGLEIPDPGWWDKQPPEAFEKLGECVALKAKGLHENLINAAEQLSPLITDS